MVTIYLLIKPAVVSCFGFREKHIVHIIERKTAAFLTLHLQTFFISSDSIVGRVLYSGAVNPGSLACQVVPKILKEGKLSLPTLGFGIEGELTGWPVPV